MISGYLYLSQHRSIKTNNFLITTSTSPTIPTSGPKAFSREASNHLTGVIYTQSLFLLTPFPVNRTFDAGPLKLHRPHRHYKFSPFCVNASPGYHGQYASPARRAGGHSTMIKPTLYAAVAMAFCCNNLDAEFFKRYSLLNSFEFIFALDCPLPWRSQVRTKFRESQKAFRSGFMRIYRIGL